MLRFPFIGLHEPQSSCNGLLIVSFWWVVLFKRAGFVVDWLGEAYAWPYAISIFQRPLFVKHGVSVLSWSSHSLGGCQDIFTVLSNQNRQPVYIF